MLPILGTLLTEGVTWIAKGLMSSGKDKLTDFVKEKTGIDLTTSELTSEEITKLKEVEFECETELKRMYYDAIKAELSHEEKMGQQDLETVTMINNTMHKELKSEHPIVYSWRPLFGLYAGFGYGTLLLAIAFAIVIGPFSNHASEFKSMIESAKGIIMIPELWYFPAVVLGLTAYTRGKEKQKRLDVISGNTENPTSLISKITSKLQSK